MKIEIEQRVLSIGESFVLQKEQNPTIRSIANEYGFSRSTVHRDLTERLNKLDKLLYIEVKKILEKNIEERHIRGGEALKRKYLKKV